MPGHDIDNRVGARNKVELYLRRVKVAKGMKRIGRIGYARAVDLEPARQKGRVRGGGEDRHGITVLGRRHRLVKLKGGRPCRHKEHSVQVERLARLLGSHQMPVMDGIKGATHNAEPKLLPVL